jgi:hypothetical protein
MSGEVPKELRDLGVQFMSLFPNSLYNVATGPNVAGIVNVMARCYRNTAPHAEFLTLINGETVGGVSAHFVDAKLDNGQSS